MNGENEYKICKECGESKTLDKFDRVKNHIRIICRKCRWKKQYKKQKDNPEFLERANEAKARVRLKHKQRIVDTLGGKCSMCGLVDDPCIYDAHHVNPQEKDRELSSLSLYSWEIIEEELKKCILLCAHCHRKLHVDNRKTLKRKGDRNGKSDSN